MNIHWMLACLIVVCAGSSAFGGEPRGTDCERAQKIRAHVASTDLMPEDVKKSLLDLASGLCPEPADVASLLDNAEKALIQEKFADALKQLEKAVKLNPSAACPRILTMARDLANKQQTQAAISLFETSLSASHDEQAFAEYQQLLDKAPKGLEAKGSSNLISKESIVRSLQPRDLQDVPEEDSYGRDNPSSRPSWSARVVFHDILFESGSARLTDGSKDQLDELGQALLSRDLSRVELFYVDGHTDSIGTSENNCELGYQRAKSVIRYLVDNWHIRPRNLVPRSYGEDNPMDDNSTYEGRRLNRRVEVLNGDAVHRRDSDSRERCR
ncbi:MAG: OmpA family protein [Thermodesulfobacteriota bacterium]